jgi:hypothetical protein
VEPRKLDKERLERMVIALIEHDRGKIENLDVDNLIPIAANILYAIDDYRQEALD